MLRLAHPAQDLEERADVVLTPAQSAVLQLVGQGLTTGRVAAKLRMRPATVDAHIRAAMERLGARTRLQAAALVPDRLHRGVDGNAAHVGLLDADEHRLLRLLGEGATLCEAARSLHLSRRTCARRLASAKAKLGARTTVEAVLQAARPHALKVLVALLACAEALADGLGVDDAFSLACAVLPF